LIEAATLRENATIKGASLGLKGHDLSSFVDNCLRLSRFIDRQNEPLKSLSTGMAGRFNLAINSQVVKPIMILDEWIGTLEMSQVGQKGILSKLIHETDILVVASHNEDLIRKICNKVILLDQGELKFYGDNLDQAFRIFNDLKMSRSSTTGIDEEESKTKSQLDGPINKNDKHFLKSNTFSLREDRLENVHFLNIGRTSIPSIKREFLGTTQEKYNFIFHSITTTIESIPFNEKICVLYREPIKRFNSGFISRLLKGKPYFDIPWSVHEQRVFTWFSDANSLAEALYSENKLLRNRALYAFYEMTFLNISLVNYYKSSGLIESRKEDILFCGNMDQPIPTIKQLLTRLDIDSTGADRFFDKDEENIANKSSELSDQAISNLKKWYSNDYEIYHYLESIKAELSK
jgi:ABC-type multidrug transport system ATPase subunit